MYYKCVGCIFSDKCERIPGGSLWYCQSDDEDIDELIDKMIDDSRDEFRIEFMRYIYGHTEEE